MKISWWQWLPIWRWRVVSTVESADEIPERLPRNAAILVAGSGEPPKWVAFDCPCRSGHRVMLNTDFRRAPSWQIDLRHTDRLTITPSVDYRGARRQCHYFVRNGRIQWTPDSVR